MNTPRTIEPAVQFALSLLRRNLRSGELRVLFVAILVAVASVTSVGFFTDRVQQTLRQQASELLAADLVVSADHEMRAEVISAARANELDITTVVQFRSMALAGELSQLAEIKAVSAGYPLRGALKLVDGVRERVATDIPPPGELWVEPDLLRRLNLDPGGRVMLGNIELRVTAVIAYEPDRGGNMFNIAPRVLMNLADLPGTQLLQEGSRARYSLLVAGDAPRVAAFRAQIEPGLQRGERVVDVTDAREEVREALNRAQRFLHLAALVSVLLAGVAVAMAARRHVERQLDACAIMRCVGARQSFITRVYVYESVALGLAASIAGCVVGYVAHAVLVEVLGTLFTEKLALPGMLPALAGVLTGMVTLLAFALPPLLQLRRVPTLRVLRRDLGALPAPAASAYVLGAVAMAALLFWQAGDTKMGVYVVLGTCATLLVLWLLAHALMFALARLRSGAGVAWRFGVSNVVRRGRGSTAQILALGTGLMALLLLTVVKSELLAAWEGRLPADTPNRFIINAQPDQLEAIRAFFAAHDVTPPELVPMVRGRLVEINAQAVVPAKYEDDHARRLAEREFNLSWAEQMRRDDNTLVAGEWWTKADYGSPVLSVEEGIAQTLGIKIGDTLTYDIAGERFTGKVKNLRKVEWDSFRANFFVVAAPGVLERYPASYIASFYLPQDRQAVLSELLRAFSNLTLIDVSAIMNKVRDIVARVSQAVEFVFLFTLLAGFVVLYAAIAATQDERVREGAILRTLGASRAQMTRGVVAEFLVIGGLAGTVAAGAASVLGWVLAERVLHVPFGFSPLLWLIGVIGGGVGVGLAGYIGTRATLNQPPLPVLRGVA